MANTNLIRTNNIISTGAFCSADCYMGGGKSHYKISNLLSDFVFNQIKSVIRNAIKPIVVAGSIALATTTSAFSHDLELFECDNGKVGFRNSITKEQVIDCQYDEAYDFHEGLGLAKVGIKDSEGKRKFGFIDKTGREITDLKYDWISDFREGLAMVKLNGKRGFIDTTGTVRIDMKYDWINNFHEGFAGVNIGIKNIGGSKLSGGKWGFIDTTGTVRIDMKYDMVGNFREGFAWVGIRDSVGNMKRGFIDTTGTVRIDMKYYDMVGDFHEGFAWVNIGGKEDLRGKSGGKWGFIDTTGKEIIPPQYDGASDFRAGKARVRLGIGNNEFCIDKQGNRVDCYD